MFAVVTVDAVHLTDSSSIKKGLEFIPSCLDLSDVPTGSSWSSDYSRLYLSSSHTIQQFDPVTNSLRHIYVSQQNDAISHIVGRDTRTVIFSISNKIHVFDCALSSIVQTFETHPRPITSLSISVDGQYLASTSSHDIHIHNLAAGTHASLQGIPSTSSSRIGSACFHYHSSPRLLIAAGKQILVYDVSRPSQPTKSIPVPDIGGNVFAVACSPFSETLIAAASSDGYVALLDLGKEKPVRILQVDEKLTTLTFSPEGGAIYAGTESGTLLSIDLRALDKPPKSVSVGAGNQPVVSLSVQPKLKPEIANKAITTKPIAKTMNVPPATRRTATTAPSSASKPPLKPAASPVKPRTVKAIPTSSSSARTVTPASKQPSKAASPKAVNQTKETKKNILSPSRDPHGNIGNGDVSLDMDTRHSKKAKLKSTTSTTSASRPGISSKVEVTSASARVVRPKPAILTGELRARAGSTSSTAAQAKKTSASPGLRESVSVSNGLAQPKKSPLRRSQTASSLSTASTRTANTATSSRPPSSVSHSTATSVSPSGPSSRPSKALLDRSPTSSPSFPAGLSELVTPLPAPSTKKSDLAILGLGSLEVDQWIQAGKEEGSANRETRDLKGKSKSVGFKDQTSDMEDEESNGEDEEERERSLSLQISPRKPLPTSDSRTTQSSSSASWAGASPDLRSTASMLNGSPAPGGGGAHELLKTIVQDVMYDFQRETKAEMTGLHLDLVRMGRVWKTELRTLMEEYVGDLKELREENERLRVENSKLRRGAY